MTYIKGVSLAIIAAAAIVAFGGAGTFAGPDTAQAAKFCAPGKVEDAGCGKGKKKEPYTGVIVWELIGWVLTTNITNMTCSTSEMEMEFSSSEGTPISGAVTALSLAGCETSGGTACTATVNNLPYEASVETSALTLADGEGISFKMVCGFLVNCTFSTKGAALTVTNGSAAEISATEVSLNRTGGFCPAVAKWDPLYEAIFPAGLTIV